MVAFEKVSQRRYWNLTERSLGGRVGIGEGPARVGKVWAFPGHTLSTEQYLEVPQVK